MQAPPYRYAHTFTRHGYHYHLQLPFTSPRIYLMYFLPFCVNNPRVHHPGRRGSMNYGIESRRVGTTLPQFPTSVLVQMDEGDPFSWGNYVAVRTSVISRYGSRLSLRAQSYRKIARFFILRETAMYRVMRSSTRE